MPGLVVNTEAAMEARKPLDEGEYHVILTGHKVVTRVAPGKFPYIQLEMTIAEDEDEYKGRKVFRTLSASPDSLWAMVDAAVAFGADSDDVTAPEVDMDAVFTELRGSSAYIQTSVREYTRKEGEEPTLQTNVDKILSEPSV